MLRSEFCHIQKTLPEMVLSSKPESASIEKEHRHFQRQLMNQREPEK